MVKWKLPPKAKIYEALSALADERVDLSHEERVASVLSSSRDKQYRVEWSADRQAFASNDNASYWRGYAGYPIIATMLAIGVIAFRKEVAEKLRGVHWKAINELFKNDYDRAVQHVLKDIDASSVWREQIEQEVDHIMTQLEQMPLERYGSRRRPPEPAGNHPARQG